MKLPAAILATAVAVAFGFGLYLLRSPAEHSEAYAQAGHLTELLHGDPRFSEVYALCAGGISVFVVAPENLAPEVKSELERFVRQHATDPNTSVRYILSEASPSPAAHTHP